MDRNHYAAGGGEYMYVCVKSEVHRRGGGGDFEKRNGIRGRWGTKANIEGLTNQKGE
jgi:hypothetical protein